VGRHSENALAIAKWLTTQPGAQDVIYPGLEQHPQHALARQQFKNGYGGIVSARLKTDDAGVRRFLAALKLFTLAESLGGVESLVNQPFAMTHASLPLELRRARGIEENLLRFSVGVEHVDDLIADLARGFAAV